MNSDTSELKPYSSWVAKRAATDIRYISWTNAEMIHVLAGLSEEWAKENNPTAQTYRQNAYDLGQALVSNKSSHYRFTNFLIEIGLTKDDNGENVNELGKIPRLYRLFDNYLEEKRVEPEKTKEDEEEKDYTG